MESAVHAAVPLRVGKKMRKRRELDALVSGVGARSGRLLSASSDEGEPWGRRTTRRRKTRPILRLAAAVALCVCVVSAATVLWLFVDVRRQIVSMRMEMDGVSTSSSSVEDALQFCHTAAKELRGNASRLHAQLAELEANHQALVKKVNTATKELAAVTEQLSAAPKLADTPRRLAELQRTVADMGSLLNGFDGTLNSAKTQAVNAVSGVEEIKTLLHNLEERTNDTIANVVANTKQGVELKNTIASLNATLVNDIQALKLRIEEVAKPTSTAAPSTTPSTTTSTSTTPSSTTTAPTTPPGLPAKPNILQ